MRPGENQIYINQEADRLLEINKESVERFIENPENRLLLTMLEQWLFERAAEIDAVSINHLQYFFGHFLTNAVLLIQNEVKAQQRRPS